MPALKQIISNKNLFLFGLILLMVGLPASKFLMSIGQFVLLGNWIIEGDFRRKWQIIRTSRVLWVMCSFFILHLIGLLWTSDFDYAFNDLKIKLPLLWFPLLFITSKPIERKETQSLLWLFTASVFVVSIICTLVWLGYTKHKVVDIRDISIFNSHIRYALMIDLTICFLLYDFFKSGKWYMYLMKALLVVWLIIFLGIMQSFTGIMILGAVLFYQAIVFLKNLEKRVFKLLAFSVMSAVVAVALYVVIKEVKKQTVALKPVVRPQQTKSGRPYHNDYESLETENGNLIWANICTDELEKEWAMRSTIKFVEKDNKGNNIASTLIRYMASKGLTKDSVGISALTKEDVTLIENGTTNYLYTNKSGIEKRIHEFMYEYDSYKRGKNPTGHSFIMRLEFWRVGMEIVSRKWLCGVGTGDAQRAYYNQYQVSGSKLSKEWQLRAHNQFLTMTIAFGITGLIVFVLYLFYPVFALKNKHYLFTAFFIISLLSMLNEDTLETQAGVTFFGFFYCLLVKDGVAGNNAKDSKNYR